MPTLSWGTHVVDWIDRSFPRQVASRVRAFGHRANESEFATQYRRNYDTCFWICELYFMVALSIPPLYLVVQLNKVGKQKNSLCNGGESYEAIVNTAKVENGGDSRPVL